MLLSATNRPLARAASGGFLLALLAGLALWLAGTGYRLRWWGLLPAFTVLRWAAYGGLVAAALSLLGMILAPPGGPPRGFSLALVRLVPRPLAAGAARPTRPPRPPPLPPPRSPLPPLSPSSRSGRVHPTPPTTAARSSRRSSVRATRTSAP